MALTTEKKGRKKKKMTLTGPREMKFETFVHLPIRNDLSSLFGENRDFTGLAAIFIKFKSRKSRFSQPLLNDWPDFHQTLPDGVFLDVDEMFKTTTRCNE